MDPNPPLNYNNINNYNNNNNISNNNFTNNNTLEKNSHSGNMYSYREDSINEPPKESNAIRRTLGEGLNPNYHPPFSQDIYRKKPSKYPKPFSESFQKMNDSKKNKNNFGESSEMRIPPQNDNINVLNKVPKLSNKAPKPLYRRRRNKETNFYYLITYITIAIFHAIMITLIGLLFKFEIKEEKNMKYNHIFLFFKDVHLFIFIGFGMLYSALRDHQWSSIFLVLVLGVIAIEFSFFYYYLWANTFSDEDWTRINIDFSILTNIEYNAASAIVAIGGLLGKLSIIQYFVIIVFETFMSSLNFFICYEKLKILDNGGTITIHFFGAIFGLSASCVLFCNEIDFIRINNNTHITSNYRSNMLAFIGSIFLWLFFPSFNVANIQMKEYNILNTGEVLGLGYITENLRYRGIINTYLSMMGSVFTSFIISPLFYNGKMKIEHILHASYVGGIVIGGCCTICSDAWAAVVIGIVASTFSILFLWRIKNLLHSIRFEDTIGIFQIFAIPGLLGGIATCIFLGNFDKSSAWETGAMEAIFGNGRDKAAVQAGLQIAGIFVSLGIAIFSGLITGLLAKLLMCAKNDYYFVDSEYFIEEEGLVFPEFEYEDERENNLNSSGNKLDLGGKEVNINNNKNFENNINNNIDDNNIDNNNNTENEESDNNKEA